MANKLFTLHGAGGGAGPGGFGSGANAPVASWFQTIELSGGDWFSWSAQNVINQLILPRISTGDNVILQGFSAGGWMVQEILATGTNLNGTLRGVICDDPVVSSIGFGNRAAGVRAALWAVREGSGWFITNAGYGSIDGLASRLGVTAQANPYFSFHHPMSYNPGSGTGPVNGPPELAQNSTWWTAGTTTPPPATNKIRVVFGMHGGGGAGGTNGYGSNADFPRGNFVTIGGNDTGVGCYIDGSFQNVTYSPAMNFGWTYKSFGRDAMLAYMTACVNRAIQMKNATDAEVIVCGFSYGGGAVCHLADYGWTMDGRIIGYIIDDPGGYPLDGCCAQGFKDPDQPYNRYDPTRKRKLYYAPGGLTDSYSDDMAALLGISRTASKYGTQHLPYTADGQAYPEMQVGTSTSWWGTVSTTPPPTTTVNKVVVGLAGIGGYVGDVTNGFGGPGYPRGAHFRTAMAQGNQAAPGGGFQWNLNDYASGLASVVAAVGNNSNDEVILHGFSDGGKFLLEMIRRGETLGGRIKGFILDDPNYNPNVLSNPAGHRIKLYAVQKPDGVWMPNELAGFDYMSQLESVFNITRVKNPYRTAHGPMIVDASNIFWTPEEGTVAGQMWWGLGATTPPPTTDGDWTTYPAEGATLVNVVASGMEITSAYPGYTGTGYIGRWYQGSEAARFASVNGGATQGARTLRFRYRLAEAASTRVIRVNGVQVGTVNFAVNANSWDANSWSTQDATVTLPAGNSIVEIGMGSGGLDLDYMQVNVTTTTTTPPPPTGGTGGLAPTVMSGENIFPADSVWYADVRALPLKSDSTTRVMGHLNDPTYRAEWGTAAYTNQVFPWFLSTTNATGTEGYPLTIVEANQPGVPLNNFKYSWSANESNVALNELIPVPLNTRREGVAGDTHFLVLQKGTHMLYEAWDTSVNGNGWSVGVIIKWDLTKYAARPDGFTSSNGAGFPFLPLAYHYDEVNENRINHATFICCSYLSAEYVWPASHLMNPQDGVRGDRLRAGDWIRIKANVDFSNRGFGPFALRIANALKKHGAIVGDLGPLWQINGLWDPRWPNSDLMTLRGIGAADFELVDPSSLRTTTTDRNNWYKITQNNSGGTTTPPPPIGTPIPIATRAGSYLVDLSNTSAQSAAASALLNECQQGWDGIYLRDSLAEATTDTDDTTKFDTNAEVQATTQAALTQIGTTLRNAGYIVIAEADDIAEYPTLSDTWEALGTGVAEPEFLREGTVLKSDTVQAQQAANVPHGSASISNPWSRFNVHHAFYQSEAAALFALATYLCFNDGVSMLALSQDSGFNDPPPYAPVEFTWDLGNQTAARTTPFTNVHMRKFDGGVAVANLSETSQTVTLGGTYADKAGVSYTSITVAANSGVVLRTSTVAPQLNANVLPASLQSALGSRAPVDFIYTLKQMVWGSENVGAGSIERYRESNIWFENGGRRIIMELRSNDPSSPTGYSSGATHDRTQRVRPGGFIQARVKCPIGNGIWPAFWLMPFDDPSDSSFEIDTLEHLGRPDRYDWNHHAGGWNNGYPINFGGTVTGLNMSDWITVGTYLGPSNTQYFINGALAPPSGQNPAPNVVTKDMHTIINLALGGSYAGTPDPAIVYPKQFIVDSVKYWGP